jgi:hypothetical protein
MTARAIVRGDAPLAPSTPWFRTPVASTEPTAMPAPIPSREADTAPQLPPDRGRAPLAAAPAVPATDDPVVVEPAVSVASPVVVQAATAVEKPVPSRPAISEAHLRFA